MKKIVTICVSFVVSISILLSTVLVASASTPDYNEFIDYDRYATYTYSTEDDFIYADINLPDEWFYSGAFDSYYQTVVNSKLLLVNISDLTDYNYFIKFNPLFNGFNHPVVGNKVSHGRFFDLQYFPKDTFLSFSIDIQFNNSLNYSVLNPLFYIVYVDEYGEILSYSKTGITVKEIDSPESTYYPLHYSYDVVAYLSDFAPTNARGFYFYFQTDGLTRPLDSESFSFNFHSFFLKFRYSDAEYNLNNQKILRDSVSNIDKTLDEIKNRPVDPEPPAGAEKFDDLQSDEKQLLDGAQNYLDDGIGFFENAAGVIFSVADGFQALKILVAPVFNLPFANGLILVSVSLGLIGTLLGLVSMVTSSINRKNVKQNKSAKQKNGK